MASCNLCGVEMVGGCAAKGCPHRAPQPSVPSGEAVAPYLVEVKSRRLPNHQGQVMSPEDAADYGSLTTKDHPHDAPYILIPLYAAPPQERVSEAMVERAVATRVFNSEADREVWRTLIREALTAALSAGRGE